MKENAKSVGRGLTSAGRHELTASASANPLVSRGLAELAQGQWHYNSGMAWLGKEEYAKAIKDFDEAIRLEPNYAAAYNYRAIVWLRKKECGKAAKDFDEAGRLDSYYAAELRVGGPPPRIYTLPFGSGSAVFFIARGISRSHRGEFELAVKEFDEAIRFDSSIVYSYDHRGRAWVHLEEYDKAIKDFDECIRLDPENAGYFLGRARAWLGKRCYKMAISDFNNAVRVEPDDTYPQAVLAWVLATCPDNTVRDGKRAIALASMACELTEWDSGWELHVLAASYAEAGQFDKAERYQAQAIQRSTTHPFSVGEENLRKQLELYKLRRPYKDETSFADAIREGYEGWRKK